MLRTNFTTLKIGLHLAFTEKIGNIQLKFIIEYK